jgi:NAD(P)H-flavin reductase
MKLFTGKIEEIRRLDDGKHQAVLSIRTGQTPKPGQYLQAHRPVEQEAVLATTLFPGGIETDKDQSRFTTASPIPLHWQPGDELLLRGPLGNGFSLPAQTGRLALAALGEDCSHLLPLAAEVLSRKGEVALFADRSPLLLPAQMEISPLAELEHGLLWANFLAVSGTPEQVASLKASLYHKQMMPCPAQALVLIPMPCGAMAACGVCAMPDRKGKTLLVCEDGPVFDWEHLPEHI